MKTKSKITPMMQQFNAVKQSHPDKIIFFRMGDFYEMFGDDAVQAAKILQIQLTSRNKNTDAIPMCGIPVHAYENYLNKLTIAGYKVAICDQTEDPSKVKGLVKREVVRIITPGTVVSPDLIHNTDNCYIGSLFFNLKNHTIGIAFCDLSIGEFETTELNLSSGYAALLELIYLYQPKELIIPTFQTEKEKKFFDEILKDIQNLFSYNQQIINYEYQDLHQFDFKKNQTSLQEHFEVLSLAGFGLSDFPNAICAAGALLQHLKDLQQSSLSHIKNIRIIQLRDQMILDEVTMKNLELFQTGNSSSENHTMVTVLDQTKTPMGARLLRKRMKAPLIKKNDIEAAYNNTDDLLQNYTAGEKIRSILQGIGDLERLIARIAMPAVVNIYDMLKLRESLKLLPALSPYLNQFTSQTLTKLADNFDPLNDIHELLTKMLLPEPHLKIKEGGFINHHVNQKLDELRDLTQNAKQHVASLESKEREKTKINSLKIKYNKIFGYYIEINNTSKHLAPEHYIRRQTLANAERYITQELKDLEEQILTAEDTICTIEIEIFEELKNHLLQQIERIQTTAEQIALLDLICNFAYLARNNNYVRPELLSTPSLTEIKICAGRHPVIEQINLDEPFIPNDLYLTSQNFIMLLTGPNMGGKSTYMRQVALIAFMAQIGCFVPAQSAILPIFDRIFTRVGASDNLVRGQSTFMMEMNEAATILNNATQRSLIILDEIGRGTSTFDGISIAWSIVKYLHKIKAITLFATHYHELTLLEDELNGVRNYHVEIKEENEKIIFLRKILAGKTDKSYGIQVAQLAGLPKEVIQEAHGILKKLTSAEKNLFHLKTEKTSLKKVNLVKEKEINLQKKQIKQLNFFKD